MIYRLSYNYIDVAVLGMSHVAPVTAFDGIDRISTAASVFDWFLTFSDETRLMWTRKMTGAKMLFLLNRYLFIASCALTVMFDQFTRLSELVRTFTYVDALPVDLHPISRGAQTQGYLGA